MGFFNTFVRTTVGVTLGLIGAVSLYAFYILATPPPQPDPSLWAHSGSKIETDGLSWTWVKTDRIGLNVITTGNPEGPLVIFLHGFPETALLAWHAQLQDFKNKKYFVIAPDMRGYNGSEKPHGVKNYRLNELALDVVGLIDHFKRDTAMLVGHDWGAAVSWWTAVTHPERLSKLIILNTPHQVAMQEYLPKHLSQIKKSWYILYFNLPWLPERFFCANDFSWATQTLASATPQTFAQADVAKYKEQWANPEIVESMLSYYRATLRYSFKEEGKLMQKIQKEHILVQPKTLILWGQHDDYLESPLAQLSLDYCRDGRLVMLNASHWLQHELPELISHHFEQFFEEAP